MIGIGLVFFMAPGTPLLFHSITFEYNIKKIKSINAY